MRQDGPLTIFELAGESVLTVVTQNMSPFASAPSETSRDVGSHGLFPASAMVRYSGQNEAPPRDCQGGAVGRLVCYAA